MRFLSSVVTLTLKELRLLARDKQAAALLFGMPAILILALSLALEDVYSDKIGTKLRVTLAVEDHGDRALAFRDNFCSEGGFELVTRPASMGDAELFRTRAAHAVVRIPAGFSSAAESFFGDLITGKSGSSETSETEPAARTLAEHRIEWVTSPTLDASYRWLLETRLAMAAAKLVRDEMARSQEKLGAELEKVGGQLTGTAAQLERAVVQMQQIAAGLDGDPAQLRTMAAAATAESAAAAEARKIREQLGMAESDRGLPLPHPGDSTIRTERSAVVLGGSPPKSADPASTEIEVRDEDEGARARPVAQGPELFMRQGGTEKVMMPTPLQQTVPGWALFAMFFIVVPLAQALHRERIDGSTRRILSLAVPGSAVVLGKVIPFVIVGIAQFAGMLAVGLFVVPQLGDLSLEVGARPMVLIPITAVAALAATSYALFVATWSRTAEQASAFGATSVVILSVLGGVMVPHFLMPSALQELAVISPLYWGHKAYLDAFLHGADLAQVATPLWVLGGFAVVCLMLSARRITD